MAADNDITDLTALNRFAAGEWDKALAFLRDRFGIAYEDCKDIFQEAFIALWDNIRAGRLDGMTSSLSTYFLAICRNKALSFLRQSEPAVNVDSEEELSAVGICAERLEEIIDLDNDTTDVAERKAALVREIVKNLPNPCDRLLWGFYRDNLSMKTLADLLGYNSEGVAKVTKHRCCEKFRARYNELCNNLF